MGSSGNPSLAAMIVGFVCIAPWILLVISAMRDKEPKQRQQTYREITPPPLRDERAGFVQAKLEKIERASR